MHKGGGVNLKDLGYDDWFRARLEENLTTEKNAARVIAVDRDRYMVGSEHGSVPAELAGRLLYCAATKDGQELHEVQQEALNRIGPALVSEGASHGGNC